MNAGKFFTNTTQSSPTISRQICRQNLKLTLNLTTIQNFNTTTSSTPMLYEEVHSTVGPHIPFLG